MPIASSSFADSKRHFLVLDALRGIAALMVVLFHMLEIYSGGDHTQQMINHGYLAVDFFFMLSGYVMAHAYDDRWHQMTLTDFFKRRIIRLHPMIILGMTFGALCFYSSASELFPKVADTTFWNLIFILIIGYTLIPVPVSMDIRGWNEMHPLNGPAWSLFLEYIANVLHALILRKLSKVVLSVLVFIAALALLHLALTSPHGDIIGGWSLEPEQLRIGFTRLLFPYMAGMLLRRLVQPTEKGNTFLMASLLLVLVLSVPRIGGHTHLWANGLYDALVVILIFPAIVFLGAISKVSSDLTQKTCTFLGNISYPLYIIHFPFAYVYYAWVSNNKVSLSGGLGVGILVMVFMILLSWLSLKWYDEPVRKWLAGRFMRR